MRSSCGLCGFASTNLDFILGQRRVENVVLAGFLTNCCVESSMRTAYEKGYHVVTLTDCCAATSQEAHDAAVKHTFPMFSIPTTYDQFVAKLG
ncbi:MAG: Isochorismatase-like protein [Monoraphidium minutum]|nr:MAG: Isochorismatase-like protein [Monoraphidium minutum]